MLARTPAQDYMRECARRDVKPLTAGTLLFLLIGIVNALVWHDVAATLVAFVFMGALGALALVQRRKSRD